MISVNITSYEVLEFQNQRYSSTSVSNSYVGGIESKIHHHSINKLFLRKLETTEDGFFEIDGECVSALQGHKITLVYDIKRKCYAEIINHNTQQRVSNPFFSKSVCTFAGASASDHISITVLLCIPFLGQYMMFKLLQANEVLSKLDVRANQLFSKTKLTSTVISAFQILIAAIATDSIDFGGFTQVLLSFLMVWGLFWATKNLMFIANTTSEIACRYQNDVETLIVQHCQHLGLKFTPEVFYQTELAKHFEPKNEEAKKSDSTPKHNPWLD